MPHFLPAITALLLLLSPGLAAAQRNGDVAGGLNNQPTSGEVRSREHSAGVAPTPQGEQARTNQVDDIYKQLMTPGTAAGPGQPATTPLHPGPAEAK